MKLVVPGLEINEGDMFAKDEFARKSFGDALLNLVSKVSDEMVISIDGRWGEGKTTFNKMWMDQLRQERVHSIYIDAFANDYCEDAFIAIAGPIIDYFEKNKGNIGSEKLSAFKEKAKKVGGQLLGWSARVGIKAATLGILKDAEIDKLAEIKDDVASDASSFVGDLIEERLKSHARNVETISSFKETLSAMPNQIGDGDKPLVVIIDELDRCRPMFAIELIEKIKHLFLVKKVVFVLVMHKRQLEESVKCVYGQNIDAHTYLQKFITVEARLPKNTTDRYSSDLVKYSRKLYRLHELETWGDDRNIFECIDALAIHFNLSLRQLERVFINISLFYSSVRENHIRIVPIIIFLAVVKVKHPYVFEKLLYGGMSYGEMIENLDLSHLSANEKNHAKLIMILDWLRYVMLSEDEFNALPDTDRITKFGRDSWRYSVDRVDLLPIFTQRLNLFFLS